MAMPKFIALKSNSNQKYLRYVHEDGKVHRFLQFSEDAILSSYTKYRVEMSRYCPRNGLFHIRCCYNNKYWVRSAETEYSIVAGADEPDEDQSKWSCTLFEVVYVDADAHTVQLRHVQLGHYTYLSTDDCHCPSDGNYLYVLSSDDNKGDVYTIIDWESLVILPKYIAFKGDNDLYLSSHVQPALQFFSNDIGDPAIVNQVLITNDGSICIKNNHIGKFWMREGVANWICTNADDTTENNPDMLFWPTRVSQNVVALRNLGNNKFCKRLTVNPLINCLNAGDSTITNETHLEIYEPVISREIYNVNFCLCGARIYNKCVVVMATADVVNGSKDTDNTINVKLKYKSYASSTWNANISSEFGVEFSMESGTAFIEEGRVKLSNCSTEFTRYKWGETEEKETEMETVYKANVAPMTVMKVKLLATKGKCDVPFSYTKRDTLFNGDQPIYDMDDGIYTGINCFNFYYEITEEKLCFKNPN